MIKYDLHIAGLTPLLINRFHEAAQEEASSGIHSRKEARSAEEDAKDRLYMLEDHPYFPAENLRQAIIAAGSRHKIGRKAATTDLAAALYIEPFAMPLFGSWKVDTRPVVIPATKGRILRHRPVFSDWKIEATIVIDPKLVEVRLVRQVIDDAGNYVGIGDFRPAKKGPHGRFSVTLWKEQN